MNYIRKILFKYKYALLIGAFLLCAFGSYIADKIYDPYILYWKQVYQVKDETSIFYYNPFVVKWHILKWKLLATERMCCTLLLFYLIPFEYKLLRRLAFLYFMFAVQNFSDRVFFNIQTVGPNDYLFYLCAFFYTLITIIKYVQFPRRIT